jgi:hypothetical protein
MSTQKGKNYGSLSLILGVLILYVILFLFFLVTDTLGEILSNPFINYSIPIGIIVFLIIKDKIEKK